jgi:hypothetical protein
MHADSKTKLLEIHRRVFLPAVPPEIILPRDSFYQFATTRDSTDPLRRVMYGLDMPLQAFFVSKTFVAFITTVVRRATVLRTCSFLDQG